MQKYQSEFIQFAIQKDVLRFGEFTLKSGRISPYFFNSGLFNDGASIAALGRYYAAAISQSGLDFDMIYGPAYKGIPLAAATAIALADHHDRNIPYAFNRKEAKDHGEGGIIVGAALQGRILIIDDVVSAGTSVRESIDIIQSEAATPVGVIIALNRQEVGSGQRSAIQEIEQDLQLAVTSIVKLEHIIEFLDHDAGLLAHKASIDRYRKQYGET
ncbi:MAG: orotate phosphoribosyltransferase [Thiohalomonadales bacterium]